MFSATLLLASCVNSASLVTESFPDNRWAKADVQHYTIAISEESTADVTLLFSHVAGPQFTKIPVVLDITAPGGVKETINVTLNLADESGKSLSECAGDVCDLRTVVKPAYSLKKGTYTFDLRNEFSGDYLPNVLAVGVELKKI